MVLRRRFALVLLLALCLLLLGCSSQSADSASGVSGAQTDLAYDESAGYDGSFEADYGGHKVVRSASLSIDSSQFDVDLAALYGALERYGGYVESSTIDGRKPETYKESGRRADLCLRVPSDQYYPFLDEVKRIGSLYQYSDNGQDITTSYVDTQTRLEVLRTQLDRLEGILAQSDNLSDILELENEISRVTLEIESLTSQLRQYDGLVNYATVEIGLYEENLISGSSEEKGVGQRIREGFTASLYGVWNFLVDVFVWFVSSLPVLLLLAVIAAAIVFLVLWLNRIGQRRSQARRAQQPPRPAAPSSYYPQPPGASRAKAPGGSAARTETTLTPIRQGKGPRRGPFPCLPSLSSNPLPAIAEALGDPWVAHGRPTR